MEYALTLLLEAIVKFYSIASNKTFLTASNGENIESPLFFLKNSNAIKKANRNLSRKQKGSNNRYRAKLALARLHKKAANQRKDFHFKTALDICGKYAFICIEDLNIKGMQCLWGKKISDLGFSEFVKILKYQASKTGSTIVEIDRYYPSSQISRQSIGFTKIFFDKFF